VKRHFREMDRDIQTQSFTVAGVGDMSGDVFGNGMLLSKATRLVAAFDHRDIFLDPEPDPVSSFAERERLFTLPRSSWQDYDKSLISEGGGIFSRSLKSIPLSPQIQAILGFDKAEASPQEVMSAILKAPVDLLWFGGIGTYIRSSQETDDAVGDRANDAIRITGRDLRARVLGEGANLGATQLGRIEAAANGVRLNTDAIDNSAGVNTSDVEVNIKIGLATPAADGRLGKEARENVLASMTEEVAGLVLRNNYLQTLALSLSERRGPEDLPFVRRLMQMLEQEGRLDRAVEYLPGDAALLEREMKGQGLTRPELAVLLAYAKLALHDQLLTSSVPDDAYLAGELTRYFPAAMRKTYPDAIETHRLRREIVATQLANAIINRGGPTLIARLMDRTGANAVAIAHAYALTRDALGLLDLNTAIDGLDTHVSGKVQLALYAEVQDVLMSRMVWFLQHVDTRAGLQSPVKRFRDGREAVVGAIETSLAPGQAARRRSRVAALVADGVEQELATLIANLPILTLVPDAVLVAETAGVPVAAAAASLFALTERLDIGHIKMAAATLKLNDHYERLAVERAGDGVDIALRRLASHIAKAHGHGTDGVEAWINLNAEAVQRLGRAVTEILNSGLSQAKLTVVSGLLGDLAPN
jgi:glutamate dehydrogenase